jgi:3'-phosphoadenosine 5'-phosphosulfate sulfotransferase (PAPS reductase)/FAD synthetase
VGIDTYMPLSDWRDGDAHAQAAAWNSPYDAAYMRANIAGGEGFDWYYASDADRIDGIRSPIADSLHGEPWVWRYKDVRGWWGNLHHNRVGGVRSGMTGWVPEGNDLADRTRFGAVDRGPTAQHLRRSKAPGGRPYFPAAPRTGCSNGSFCGHLTTGAGRQSALGGPMAGTCSTSTHHLWTWMRGLFRRFHKDAVTWAMR